MQLGTVPNSGFLSSTINLTDYEISIDYGTADFKPSNAAWSPKDGGLKFDHTVSGSPLPSATSVDLFWARGPLLADRISSTPFYQQPIPINEGATAKSCLIIC